MRGVGDDDPPPRRGLASFRVVGLEHEQRGELRLRTGLRLQAHEIHAGGLRQHLLELVREREDTLGRAIRLTRMQVGEQ